MLVDVYTKEGQVSGQIELRDDIFGIEPNDEAMHKAVVVQLAHGRQGTRKTKGRSEVSGGGKKPWRQKGRGTARAGSSRSPLWVGGGTIHGPQPHTFDPKLPKKVKKLAKRSAISLRCAEKNVLVVEDFEFDQIKTSQMANVLKNLKIDGEKILVLLPATNEKIFLSTRNIENVSIFPVEQISTYDILNHKKLLLFKGAIDKLVETFSN